MVDEWLAFYPYTSNSKAVSISLLQEYTKYLNFLRYEDFIPDDDYVIKRTAYNPYLFTDDELFALFNTIDSYTGCASGIYPSSLLLWPPPPPTGTTGDTYQGCRPRNRGCLY